MRLPNGPRMRTGSIVTTEGRDNDPTATALNNMDYYDAMLEKERNALAGELIRLEDMLAVLRDRKDQAIMRYFYSQGRSDAWIADEMGISIRHVQRRRDSAVGYIVKGENRYKCR